MKLAIQERLQAIQKKKNQSVTSLKWNQQQKQWISYPQTFHNEPIQKQEIVTVCYNVLTDLFGTKDHRPNVIHSQERYTSILSDLSKIHPDIASFNEVTKNFYRMVKECEWIRKQYWINYYNYEQKKGFSNMLITKMKPLCYEKIRVHKLPRPAQVGFFHIKNQNNQDLIFTFTSVHLIALSTNTNKRVQQIQDLRKQLGSYDTIVDAHVLQGDMNFHSEAQNEILPSLQLKDAWLLKYNNNLEDHPGYTFDTKYNQMINEIYWGFEGRRMRLDRIFMTGNLLQVEEIKVIFDEPIHGEKKEVKRNNFVKGALSFISDSVFSHNLFREKDKYLFKSDHFGLQATLKIK